MNNTKAIELLFVIAVVFTLALSGMYMLGVGIPLLVRAVAPLVGAL